ncbi:MAG: zinc ribbon domain-containing protein [Verrucomicrobia bacterium]|nr:zinc ribbon domain-containing protein [Verrucomicrobiota bacterium]
MLREALKVILDVQELDIQMIRLMRLKWEREGELARIRSLRDDLHHQVIAKESEVIDLKKQIRLAEVDVSELNTKIQKLESQQNAVKKVEEFNALTHEIAAAEREKAAKEQRLSDLYDRQAAEEELLKNLKETFEATKTNSELLEQEIISSIVAINQEGSQLKEQRDQMQGDADPEILVIYEKLIKNKKDRVVVPIENRCCSGCHILVTAQHENVVRKGDKMVFCEHCSRIHYWQDHLVEVSEDKTTRRRRRSTAKA